jgi:hypothetical protein
VAVKSLLKLHTPTVWIRHFNFHDLKRLGYHWQPEWFAVVRDPLEKVQNHIFCKVFTSMDQPIAILRLFHGITMNDKWAGKLLMRISNNKEFLSQMLKT